MMMMMMMIHLSESRCARGFSFFSLLETVMLLVSKQEMHLCSGIVFGRLLFESFHASQPTVIIQYSSLLPSLYS